MVFHSKHHSLKRVRACVRLRTSISLSLSRTVPYSLALSLCTRACRSGGWVHAPSQLPTSLSLSSSIPPLLLSSSPRDLAPSRADPLRHLVNAQADVPLARRVGLRQRRPRLRLARRHR